LYHYLVMYQEKLNEFTGSGDSLWVFDGERKIFCSSEKMLLPMLRYIKEVSGAHDGVVIFDKIIGNAAALLMVIARCKEAYCPLASKLALSTLDSHNIRHYAATVVPVIQRAGMDEICPMEKLSMGKDPQGLYELLKDLV
jgi:hypothetical protein